MGILDSVEKPHDRPVIMTILGDAGRGKTSLAVTFPKPIVIRAEDGLQAIPFDQRPDAFPLIHKVPELWDQLAALLKEEHEYKTLIIDSVSALDRIFTDHILSGDMDGKPARSLQSACGGYGAGNDVLGGMHQRVRKAAGFLNQRRGMNIVFIAHADTARMEPPDGDAYMSYIPRVHKKGFPAYVDDVDLVGFLKLETFAVGEGDKKRAVSDGTRHLICRADAASVSKNRFGIEEPIVFELGTNPLEQYIPALKNEVKK